jgi:hypothetical protein
MNTREFLQSLALRNIKLLLENGHLQYRTSNGAPGEALLAEIRERRHEIIDELETSDLTHGQAALWFLHELERESTAYNTVLAAGLPSDLDEAAFEAALDELHLRHSALRSRFGSSNGKPHRRAGQDTSAHLAGTDAAGWTGAKVDDYLRELADQAFDLECGPVVRWNLLETQYRQSSFRVNTTFDADALMIGLTFETFRGSFVIRSFIRLGG